MWVQVRVRATLCYLCNAHHFARMLPLFHKLSRKLYASYSRHDPKRKFLSHTMSALTNLEAPIAPQRPHKIAFGKVEGENRGENPFFPIRYRDDPWFWLRDDTRKNEEILNHLRKENAYTEQKTEHLEKFRKNLYDEHISHLKETDENPPYPYGKYYYYTKTVKGLSYKIHCRKEASSLEELESATEEIILDENKVAEGHKQCVIRGVKPSVDHTFLAYSVDYKGDETYTVKMLNLKTGEYCKDVVEGVAGGIQWGKDNSTFFYLSQDQAKRPYKLWKHVVGTSQEDDKCYYTEEDELFWFGHGKSKDGRYLFAGSGSSETSEVRYIDLYAEETKLVVIQKREFGLRYDVEHREGMLLIWTNLDGAINQRLMVTSIDKPGKENWKEIIPYDPTRKIDDVEVFKNFIAIEGRQDGLTQIWTISMNEDSTVDPQSFRKIEFKEEMYECAIVSSK